MLDAFIIEELLKAERLRELHKQERPRVEMPLYPPEREESAPPEGQTGRGVIIIDVLDPD